MISTTPGTQCTVCAAGNGNCCRRECTGCQGCTSYVNGSGLSNFCAVGGCAGCANTSWTTACHSFWSCCRQAGDNGGDFGYMVAMLAHSVLLVVVWCWILPLQPSKY